MTTQATLDHIGLYVDRFRAMADRWTQSEPEWLVARRREALDRFTDIGFPTRRMEEYLYTDMQPLGRIAFQPAGSLDHEAPARKALEALYWTEFSGARLVFVNGRYSPEHSNVAGLPDGVVLTTLAQAVRECPEAVEPHLARHASLERAPFVALNTAFLEDGAFLRLGEGKTVEPPIVLLFVTTGAGQPTVSHPRNLVLAGPGSQATVIERYVGLSDQVYFTNPVTEIVAGPDAVLRRFKVQQEGGAAFHAGALHVRQERNSTVENLAVAVGGALMRDEITYHLAGEGAHGALNGLHLARDRQQMDSHTTIEHAAPHCTSHELYKGVLDGKSRGAFRGKIHVWPGAQKTDAIQTNQNLLLSEDAVVNAKPQLEIYADDVRCTHGATIGQLDENMIFYLRARGIGVEAARDLLTYGFAGDLLEEVRPDGLHRELERLVFDWMVGDERRDLV